MWVSETIRSLAVAREPAETIAHAAVHEGMMRLREDGLARSGAVGRPAVAVVLDGQAFEGGKASDYLLELGGGQLIEGFEEQLSGATGGETRKVEVTFPDDHQAEHDRHRSAPHSAHPVAIRLEPRPVTPPDQARERDDQDDCADS